MKIKSRHLPALKHSKDVQVHSYLYKDVNIKNKLKIKTYVSGGIG